MKKLLCLLFICIITISSLKAQSHFFYDLKGLEDSNGTTQLFYREFLQEREVYSGCGVWWRNNIYQMNASQNSDSLKFRSNRGEFCINNHTNIIADYTFLNNAQSKWVKIQNTEDEFGNSPGRIEAFNGSFFDTGNSAYESENGLNTHWATKIESGNTDSSRFVVFDFPEKSILVILQNDSLPSEHYNYPYLLKRSDPEETCPDENPDCFLGASDSVHIMDYNFLSVNRNKKNEIFFQRNDTLFASDDLGRTTTPLNAEFNWSTIDQFAFSTDSSMILAASQAKFQPGNPQADSLSSYQLLRSENGGADWEIIKTDTSKIYLNSSFSNTDTFYHAIRTEIYPTPDWVSQIKFEDGITGLYKKPDSDILYVLTKKELFKVENGQKTSLKKIPSSNEKQPRIPNQIKLAQNYPNPFNPTTNIQFELNQAGLVTLSVFDALGRKIQTLINSRQSAGAHSVQFDATDLSSGIYYYQLTSGDRTHIKRMTLIK